MVSLFQEFEFVYGDGELFHDKSGALTRRLKETFPDLLVTSTERLQRKCEVQGEQISMVIGLAVSLFQSFSSSEKEFAGKAARFLKAVCNCLEVETLQTFRYKHVMGKPLSTAKQAQDLMWPLIGNEQKALLTSVAPQLAWTSLQGEFTEGHFAFESRVAVMDLLPPPDFNIGVQLIEKMRRIIFPSVQCSGASLREIIEYLSVKSRDLDAFAPTDNERGVNMVLESGLESNAAITLDLKDVPLLEAVRYVTELAAVKTKLAPDCVFIVNPSDAGTLPHITYHLQAERKVPTTLTEFNVEEFIHNFHQQHFHAIRSKLAPHF